MKHPVPPSDGLMTAETVGRLDGELRWWVVLAVGTLGISAVLAFVVGIARMPGVSSQVPSIFSLLMRMEHSIFTNLLWPLVMLGALSSWALSGLVEDGVEPRAEWCGALGVRGVAAGLVLMLIPAIAGWGYPVSSPFLPVIFHPLYLAGLVVVLAAVTLPILRLLLSLPRGASGLAYGVAAAGFSYLVALVCVFLGWWSQARIGVAPTALLESISSGSSHVLSFVFVGMILVGWWALLETRHGEAPTGDRGLRRLAASVASVTLLAPLFYVIVTPNGLDQLFLFMGLKGLGLIVQPLVAIALIVRAMIRHPARWTDPVWLGVGLSILVLVFAGALGYGLGGESARVLAHGQVAGGAVSLILMLMVLHLLLPRLGSIQIGTRWDLALVWLFVAGQLLFGVGHLCRAWIEDRAGDLFQAVEITIGLGQALSIMGVVIFLVIALRRLSYVSEK